MNIVRELRKQKGMQQKELALSVGVAQATVSEWEHGKKDPSGDRLKKLADIFHVDELTILGRGLVELSTEEEEAWAVREQLRRDPNMRVLFAAASKATPEQLKAAAAMLKALQGDGDEA